MDDAEDRVHAPSPQRLERARADGQVVRSQELSAGISMLGAITAGYLTVEQIGRWLANLTRQAWVWPLDTGQPLTEAMAIGQLQDIAWSALSALLPLMATLLFAAGVSDWLQTGPLWAPKRVAPDWQRLTPRHWLERLRPGQLMAHLGLGIPRIAVAVTVMGLSIWHRRAAVWELAALPADQMVQSMAGLIAGSLLTVTVALLVLASVDFGRAWLDYRRKLRMTDQELRDEQRDQEGDSVNRSRQRGLNRV